MVLLFCLRFLFPHHLFTLQFTKCGQNQVVSRVLFLFSMVFIPIVLLNLLIGNKTLLNDCELSIVS